MAFISKKKDINDVDAGEIGFDASDVFIGEHLTPYFGKLAFKCRCLKREKKLIGTRVLNGSVRILVEVKGKPKWLTVTHEDDLLPYNEPKYNLSESDG